MTNHADDPMHAAVAIVGMAGRFPQADSITEYWELLRDGREGIRHFSPEELVQNGTPPNAVNHTAYVPAKGHLKDAEQFEAELFGYHPRDARVIDPQQRLLLECCWEALEDAGCDPARFAGAIGVFAGVSMNAWLNQLHADPEIVEKAGWYQLMISNDKDYAPTRVSYQLNLRGPSIAVQTACSTSLVAVSQACQSLAGGECDMALAGAAALAFPRKSGYFFEEGMILSPDGHCRPFDAQARGTVPGEGVGVVALKRLEDAVADGDRIEAVIRGWAVNNDGSHKVGFTAPSIEGQAEVIRAAQMFAGVSADTIDYIEAHGTATPLGDPIEIAALTDAFGGGKGRAHRCRIGSVKSNLGHLDTAAGIAGLIKTVLALRHRQIPPSLHYESPNPEIDFEQTPFVVNAHLARWEARESPRRAGVSSFGIGGTNCHLVLEEAPAPAPSESNSTPQLLVVSGASASAVQQNQQRLADWLDASAREDNAPALADVAFTLQTGRAELRHRRALVCSNAKEAIDNLRSPGASQILAGEAPEQPLSIMWMFPGQGAQFPGMARGLYHDFASFRAAFDRCAEILRDHCGWDLSESILTPVDNARATDQLDETVVTQPVLFATSYALAKTLMDWGVEPAAMVGHSIGEFVAACLADVMTLKDALRVVFTRGRLMQKTDPGAMLAVAWEGETGIEEFLNGRCEIAAINAPGAVVLSGRKKTICELKSELDARSIHTCLLRTSRGFHSSLMDPILDEFREFMEQVTLRAPSKPFVSTVTGRWILPEEAIDAGYWTKAIRQPVQFQQTVNCLCPPGSRNILLEVGPGRTLQTLARRTLGLGSDCTTISCMRSPDSDRSDAWTLLEAIGQLWTKGQRIDWARIHGSHKRRRISLPTYAFQRRDFSMSAEVRRQRPSKLARQIDKLPLSRWFYAPSWTRRELTSATRLEDETTHSWLVFCDDDGIGQVLGEKLKRRGHEVTCVRPGEEFGQVGDNDFVINPKLYGNYSQLLNTISTRRRHVNRVLHCWTLSASREHDFEQMQELGFYSLLFLSQALGRRPVADAVRIDVVSSEVQDVLGVEAHCAAKATIRAPLIVVPQEYPHIICQHLDVESNDVADHPERVVASVLQELEHERPGTEAAIRGRSRWLRTYERLALGKPKNDVAEAQGVWIVIGGFGQIGLTAASWIAHTKNAPVMLVSRAEMPGAGAWDAWLQDHDAADTTSRKILAVRQLAATGVKITAASADVADEAALRQIAAQAIRQHGTIAGFIHSAGVVHNRIIHYTSPADCERQFRAKVAGVEALAEVAKEFHVPVCLVNSSLSSVLGGLGFCAYTASNLYLDAFLRQQNRSGATRWIGVNWDGWLFPNVAEILKDDPALHLTLTPEEGFAAFDRIAGSAEVTQVVVSTGDLEKRLDAWVYRQAVEPESSRQEDPGSQARFPRPNNLSSIYVAPSTATEKTIASVWADLLGIDGIGANDDFIELGGHSLLAGQIIGRLRDQLETPISIRSLFTFPTVAALALHVEAVRLTFEDDEQNATTGERTEVEF